MENSHRMFLQSVMSKGILVGKDVRNLYRSCCQKFNDEHPDEGLVEFVNVINMNIKPVHLEIRKGISEENGSHCYCLVNTKDSDYMKLASDYTVHELEFFKKLVETVVESKTGTVPSTDALNLVSQLERLNRKDVQELLNRMEREHWLTKNTEGCYTLSPRSILELEQFLFEKYPESTFKCNMCKRICIQGQSCESCPVRIHNHCANTYFGKKATKSCPGSDCNKMWTHEVSPSKSPTKVDAHSQGVLSIEAPPPVHGTRKRRADGQT